MKSLICWLFGHRWTLRDYEDAPDGWSYEFHTCTRCHETSRQLVASRQG